MATKKELKEAYKQMKFRMGIYQIRNIKNDKIFLGSSNNIDAIWNRHRMQLNFGNHPNKQLQNDWKQFGEETFSYEIISELEQDDTQKVDYDHELKILERLYLEELKPFGEKGYNQQSPLSP